MFDMFADLDKLGKQVTVFLNEAKETLEILKREVSALREENRELREQVTRIEGAHHMLMNWLADIEGESEEVAEAEESAEVAEAAAVVAEEAAAEAIEAAAESVDEPLEEVTVPEPVTQGTNAPPAGEIPATPATPLPVTPVVPAVEDVPPQPAPLSNTSQPAKKKRVWI